MPRTNGETALAKTQEFGPLAALAESVGDLAESFKENVGGGITLFDLDQLQVPAGGGQAWAVETLEGAKTTEKLRGVLLHVQQARQYYKSSDAVEGTPPDCAAPDGVSGFGDRGLTSDRDGAPFDCATCPHAQWESAVGKDGAETRGQACKQRLHVLFLHELGGAMPAFLSLPPTSLKAMKKYLVRLAGGGKRFYTVLTEIGLEKAKSATGIAYSKATFRYAGDLSPAQAQVSATLRESLLGVVERGVPTAPRVAPEETEPEPAANIPSDPETDPDSPE